MARVRLSNVGKQYDGGIVAVREASFDVGDGEFVVLVGPSGCGKSTLLRMIAGLEEITWGDLLIDGERMNDVEPKDRDIAMVFQNYALYPHMTVYENLAFGLRLRKIARHEIDRRVRDAADSLDIATILDRKPGQLSGGQRQRVALGRAIVRQPRVFLFDEPLSNLDAKLRVQTRMELSKLHRRLGATMIFVTHDQVEAMTMGDRIVVMHEGVIQQIAEPLTLYARPQNRFVAGFIGSPAMNFLKGSIRHDDGLWFESGQGVRVNLTGADIPRSAMDSMVEIGIRPENIAIDPFPDGSPCACVDTTVDLLEPMGNEVVLYTSLHDVAIVARVGPCDLPGPGEPVRLYFNLEKLYVFDGASGRAL